VQASSNRLLPISQFNRAALEDIGIDEQRIGVMPLGYAPEIDTLYPEGVEIGKRDRLHALVITNSHDLERYGSDLLVEALGCAFTDKDAVVLHIKDYGSGIGNRRLEEWIAAEPQFPEIVWHREFLSRDDLIRLYASMDVLIAPFRGEGFGMKVVDAMALGLPVLMPAFGGPMEFAAEGTFIAIPHREVPVGACYDRKQFYLSEGAYWCEVELAPFVAQLRQLPTMRNELRAVGHRARQHVHLNYSWDAAAERFCKQLEYWASKRAAVISARSGPSALDLSVIIPTKNREDILHKTLDQYARQQPFDAEWELLVINDGGDEQKVREVTALFEDRLPLKVWTNEGHSGPAGARNAAIKKARGHILLITGDDIIPAKDFLAQHMAMHRQHTLLEDAVLGQTLWSPELESTPFMEYLTGEGGQQFAYRDLRHGALAPYDRFYTSNISLKREFLIEEEQLFNTGFRYAAYEDIELAYRLSLRGLRLRYNAEAKGYHHHAMDPESFLRRQILVGRMLTHFCLVQPSYVPDEHAVFLNACVFLSANPDLVDASTVGDPELFIRDWATLFRQQIEQLPQLVAHTIKARRDDNEVYQRWLLRKRGLTWEALNEVALRIGMAHEWAHEDEALKRRASAWVVGLAFPSVLKSSGAEFSHFFLMGNTGRAIANPLLRIAIHGYQRMGRWPVVGLWVQRFQRSRLFFMCKRCIIKHAK